jgi:hypothetical protein
VGGIGPEITIQSSQIGMSSNAKRIKLALEVFEPGPGALYSLDATAHLTEVSRRTILIYCRSGLIEPMKQPPYGALFFDEAAIRSIRQIERLRSTHGINLAGLRIIFDLLRELERLQEETEFLRQP